MYGICLSPPFMSVPTYNICPHLLCLSPPIMSVPTYYVCPHLLCLSPPILSVPTHIFFAHKPFLNLECGTSSPACIWYFSPVMSIWKHWSQRSRRTFPAQHLVLNFAKLLPEIGIIRAGLCDGRVPGAGIHAVWGVQVSRTWSFLSETILLEKNVTFQGTDIVRPELGLLCEGDVSSVRIKWHLGKSSENIFELLHSFVACMWYTCSATIGFKLSLYWDLSGKKFTLRPSLQQFLLSKQLLTLATPPVRMRTSPGSISRQHSLATQPDNKI